MPARGDRLHRFRAVLLLALILIGFGLLLTRCPANRDGVPGQLARAMKETTSAARSGALALDLRQQRRATDALTSVALSDARDDVVKAYREVADLRVQDPVDVERRKKLTDAMTAIVGQLNAAAATIRHVTDEPVPSTARAGLLAAADALQSG